MIPQFNTNEIAEISTLVNQSKMVVITTHHKPDGDAIGSSMALYEFLTSLGIETHVVLPSDYPDFLLWMTKGQQVHTYDINAAKCVELMLKANTIFCLDFNEATRVEKLTESLMQSKAKKIMIDHHLEPVNFCDYTLSYPTAGSTAELVFHFVQALDSNYKISKYAASCLYAGVMTDTGSFRFSSTTGDTHRMIAKLIDCGVVPNEIYEAIFDNYSEQRTRFLGYCLKEKMVVFPQYNAAYMAITKDELKQYNHQTGDTEGIVNYALGIKGIKMAAFFCEHDTIIKISFRSKGKFSVKELAASHFNGGGHQNAAGGKSMDSLADTIAKFESLLKQYESALLQT